MPSPEELKAQIIAPVHNLLAQHAGAELHITGHSLGAAMAVLSGAHFQTQENIDVHQLYTFGLPRVGDANFSKWFHENLPGAIHVTHYHDVRMGMLPRCLPHLWVLTCRDVVASRLFLICRPSGCSATTIHRQRCGTLKRRGLSTRCATDLVKIRPAPTASTFGTTAPKTIATTWTTPFAGVSRPRPMALRSPVHGPRPR